MKQRIRFLSVFLAAVALLCGVVFATDGGKTLEVVYRNIRIFVDGAEIVPKDVNGNIVEPFVYQGTTYLPVRAVASALGKDVVWDGATSSVYLGKTDANQPDNYLDRIQYVDVTVAKKQSSNTFSVLNGTVTDFLGKTYTSGVYVGASEGSVDGNAFDTARLKVDYPLNGQYTYLKGTAVIPASIQSVGFNKSVNSGMLEDPFYAPVYNVFFYGDGELLTTVKYITNSMPMDFELDVTSVNMLSITIDDSNRGTNSYTSHLALTDLALYE